MDGFHTLLPPYVLTTGRKFRRSECPATRPLGYQPKVDPSTRRLLHGSQAVAPAVVEDRLAAARLADRVGQRVDVVHDLLVTACPSGYCGSLISSRHTTAGSSL